MLIFFASVNASRESTFGGLTILISMPSLNNRFWKLFLAFAGICVILQIADHPFHILPVTPHIKQITWAVFLSSGIILLYIYAAKLLKEPPPLAGAASEQITILAYGANRISDIDKILFNKNGDSGWLHFPPHTAKYIMGIAPKNSIAYVSFQPTIRKAPDDKPMYELLSIQSSIGVLSTNAIPPPAPATGKSIELAGKIKEYCTDEKGMISGFIMEKYIIEIPKHIEQNIIPLLQAGKEVAIKGYERSTNDGFVNTTGFTLVKPYAITIDQTYYLL